jgi:hypothetical protein
VKIEGASTDATTTGRKYTCLTETSEFSTEEVRGTTELACQLVWRRAGNKTLTVDLYRIFRESVYRCSHGSENVKEDLDVIYGRNVVDYAGLLIERTSAYYGKSSVFHTVDSDIAVKRTSAVDDDLFHE